jgi:hypothetical protein
MVCCITLGVVFAFLIRGWRLLTLRPLPEPVLFAPVAQRRFDWAVHGDDGQGSGRLSGEEYWLDAPSGAISRSVTDGAVGAGQTPLALTLEQRRWYYLGSAVFVLGVVWSLITTLDAWWGQWFSWHAPALVGCGFPAQQASWWLSTLHVGFHASGVLAVILGWWLLRKVRQGTARRRKTPRFDLSR